MTEALINGRVLIGENFVSGQAVLIDNGRIVDVLPATDERIQQAETTHDLKGNLLLPGFIDTQVNGGGGALFNDEPSVSTIKQIGDAHRQFGTTGFLPTLISDDLDVVAAAMAAAQAAIEAKVPGVLGIHIEGPFINVARKGIHDPAKLRRLNESAIGLLTSLRGGKTLVTLAPEMTTPDIIQTLTKAGVVVAAGHTNATYQQIREAIAHGLTGFTHLFNAMSQLTAREPGVVGAALDDPDSYCGIIVDGRHVDPVVLRLALRAKRNDRFMLVTDGMPTIGTSNKSFDLGGRIISVKNGVIVDEFGTLAGSDTDMAAAVRNAVQMLNVATPLAIRMASEFPAKFLGLNAEYGKIAKGYRANLIEANDDLNVLKTWINGL